MQKPLLPVSLQRFFAYACVATVMFLPSCSGSTDGASSDNGAEPQSTSSPSPSAVAASTPSAPVAEAKQAAGKGNVRGQVLYNGKPAENIEVQLCETFSQFMGSCDGKTFKATTGKDGYYVIADVAPGKYESLLARVFDTNSYIFAATGTAGMDVVEYNVTANNTLSANPINLFKSDLKLVNPSAGSQVSGQNLELSWDAYPDAVYYKLNVYPEGSSTVGNSIYERVDGTSFAVPKTLANGTYRWTVEAYNSSDQKLAESGDNIKFTVK